MTQECKHKNKEGGPCKATVRRSKSFCWMHDPEVSEEEKFLAKQKGGKSNKPKVIEALASLKIKTPTDVLYLLEDTANAVRSNKMDVRVATGLTYISSMMLKAISQIREQDSDLEDQVIVVQWTDSGHLEIGPMDREKGEGLKKESETDLL